MNERWENALACVMNGGRECLAREPVACLCRQMPEEVYQLQLAVVNRKPTSAVLHNPIPSDTRS